MKKRLSKTVAALISISCLCNIMTASYDGRVLFPQEITSASSAGSSVPSYSETDILTLRENSVQVAQDKLSVAEILTPPSVSESGSCASFDEATGTLTLSGNVVKEEVQAWVGNQNVKKVICADGTVFPSDCSQLFNNGQRYSRSYVEYIDLSNADTSRVTNMAGMFACCERLEYVNLSNVDTRNVTDMSQMFHICFNITSIDFSSFDTSNVENMRGMFYGCRSLKSLDLSMFDTKNVRNMFFMFEDCKELEDIVFGDSFDTRNVEDMSCMFFNCEKLKYLDLSVFDTGNVRDFSKMFYNCPSLKMLDISNFDTSSCETAECMFVGCSSLEELDVSSFDTSKINDFTCMFSGCENLKELDVSGFHTDNASDMSGMFGNCSSLENLNVSGFKTCNVSDIGGMFSGCENLKELDLSNFDTSKCTDMSYMFTNCKSLESLDLSNFETSKVEDMIDMFYGCSELKTIYVSDKWNDNIPNNRNSNETIFTGCVNLVGGNGTVFDASHTGADRARIDTSDKPGYLTKAPLIFNWSRFFNFIIGMSNNNSIPGARFALDYMADIARRYIDSETNGSFSKYSAVITDNTIIYEYDNAMHILNTNGRIEANSNVIIYEEKNGKGRISKDSESTSKWVELKFVRKPFNKYTAFITENTIIYEYDNAMHILNTDGRIEANSKVTIYEEKDGKGRISEDGKSTSKWVELSKISTSTNNTIPTNSNENDSNNNNDTSSTDNTTNNNDETNTNNEMQKNDNANTSDNNEPSYREINIIELLGLYDKDQKAAIQPATSDTNLCNLDSYSDAILKFIPNEPQLYRLFIWPVDLQENIEIEVCQEVSKNEYQLILPIFGKDVYQLNGESTYYIRAHYTNHQNNRVTPNSINVCIYNFKTHTVTDIDDEQLNDSDFPTKIVPEDKDKDNQYNIDKYVTKFESVISNNELTIYHLKPISDSFYEINAHSNCDNTSIHVYLKDKNCYTEIEKTENNDYLLHGNSDYIIGVYSNSTSSDINVFECRQNNWIYIPKGYGCYQTILTRSNIGAITSTPFESRYYLTQELFYAIIGDLVGSEFDLNATDEVNKIMRDLGYLDSQYEITGKDVAAVVVSDVILVLSIYTLGATTAASESGYAVLFATKANAASTVGGVLSIGYDFVFTPHIDLYKKMLNYLEKKDMEDTLKNCESSSTGRYDIACANYLGIGLNNLWEPWTTNGYVYKFDPYQDVLNTELLDPSDITRIEDAMEWS